MGKALSCRSDFVQLKLIERLLLILHLVLRVSLGWLSLSKLTHWGLILRFRGLSLLLVLLRHVLRKILWLLPEELGEHIHDFGLYDLIGCRLHKHLLLPVPLNIRLNLPRGVRCTLGVLVLLYLLGQVMLLWNWRSCFLPYVGLVASASLSRRVCCSKNLFN
jgi:hypothetical protein